MLKYRVIIKVSYYEAWFEFDEAEEAGVFATTLLQKMVTSPDQKKQSSITIKLIDVEAEAKAKEEDEEDE